MHLAVWHLDLGVIGRSPGGLRLRSEVGDDLVGVLLLLLLLLLMLLPRYCSETGYGQGGTIKETATAIGVEHGYGLAVGMGVGLGLSECER
jgi:hypothetical protein